VEPKRISDAALRLLGGFDFPGNVRQLENVCHWLTVMAPAQVIEVKDLPPEVLAVSGAALVEPPSAAPPPVAALVVDPAPMGWVAPPVVPAQAPTAEPTPLVGAAVMPGPGVASEVTTGLAAWESGLQAEAQALLEAGRTDVWDVLTRRFETRLIETALANTRGRRIEAAHKLGIGRNTITRKIQELGME
jgi:two-component system nitrogen regulation response regulator GlnG